MQIYLKNALDIAVILPIRKHLPLQSPAYSPEGGWVRRGGFEKGEGWEGGLEGVKFGVGWKGVSRKGLSWLKGMGKKGMNWWIWGYSFL